MNENEATVSADRALSDDGDSLKGKEKGRFFLLFSFLNTTYRYDNQ